MNSVSSGMENISYANVAYEFAPDASLEVTVAGDDGEMAAAEASEEIPLLDDQRESVVELVSEMCPAASCFDEAPRMSRLGAPLGERVCDQIHGALLSANQPGNDVVSIAFGEGLCLLGHEASVRAIFEGVGAFMSELRVWKLQNHISAIVISMERGAYDAWARFMGRREGWPVVALTAMIATPASSVKVNYAGPREINMLTLARFCEWQREGLQVHVCWRDEDSGAGREMTGRIVEANETFYSHYDVCDGHIMLRLSDGVAEQGFYVWQIESLELFTKKDLLR